MGISGITNHAVVRFIQLIQGVGVEDDYRPNLQDRMTAEPVILERILSAKILTSQQALVIVNSKTRVSVVSMRAMGNDDFQTEGASSFYGRIYDDGDACFVVDNRNLVTIIVPEFDQRQAFEDILERASQPSLMLVPSAPDPAPFELCLIRENPSGKGGLAISRESLRAWLNRFKRFHPKDVRILHSSKYRSSGEFEIDEVVKRLDPRPQSVTGLPLWSPDMGPDRLKAWKAILLSPSRPYRFTIVMCATPEELVLALSCLTNERTPITEEEAKLPPGLVYAVDPEILSSCKLSSFRLPI